jgi:hypothetical protein
MSKYNNKKTEVDGFLFDSKKEANRYTDLVLLEKAGEIAELELQPTFVLLEGFRDSEGKWRRPITYTADFRYKEGGKIIVEDVKGHKTKVFLIKQKLFLKKYQDVEFRLT